MSWVLHPVHSRGPRRHEFHRKVGIIVGKLAHLVPNFGKKSNIYNKIQKFYLAVELNLVKEDITNCNIFSHIRNTYLIQKTLKKVVRGTHGDISKITEPQISKSLSYTKHHSDKSVPSLHQAVIEWGRYI